jgi:fibronectin-binding autotransporter adhesin
MAGISTSLRAFGMAAVLGLCGCSGGGGSAANVDLTGYWMLYLTPAGGTETGPAPVYLSQTGATVDGASITGSVSGSNFALSTTVSGLFTIQLLGSLSGHTGNGTMTITGVITGSGTFRIVGFTPTGTMTADGTLQSVAVAMDTAAAIGARVYTDPGLTALDRVDITAAYGSQDLEIAISAASLTTGALAVPGTVTATATFRDDANQIELDADGGTITVTTYDDTGFAGSFALTFPGGGTLTGTFDVSWDMSTYAP